MTGEPHVVDPELLEIMRCPECAGPLEERRVPPSLVCVQCRLSYPVDDGIPIMLVDEAKPLDGESG